MQTSPNRAVRSLPARQSQSSGRTNRRGFLSASAAATAVVTFGSTAPSLLRRAAAAAADEDRVLVVVEMAGGNDGLSTVIPIADPEYAKARPKLAIAAADTLRINDEFGLNSSLSGFADLLQQGHFAVVQGVGYENPNRSHFESMDIWHSCLRKDAVRRTDGSDGIWIRPGSARLPIRRRSIWVPRNNLSR